MLFTLYLAPSPNTLLIQSFADRLDCRQYSISVTLEVHIRPHLLDAPVWTDQNSATQNTHELFTITLTFAPEAPLLQHNVTNIGQQGEIQTMLFGKGLVGGDVIGADAIDGNVQGVKLRNSITEFRCFDRSPIGVIFWVGKDHIALP